MEENHNALVKGMGRKGREEEIQKDIIVEGADLDFDGVGAVVDLRPPWHGVEAGEEPSRPWRHHAIACWI